MLNSRQKLIKRLVLPLALLVFLGLFVTDIFFVPRADSAQIDRQIEIISSQIAGTPEDTSISKDPSPRIDSEAAMIERVIRSTPACPTLPGELWIFLLATYLFLLFFNLFYDFEQTAKIHWSWEGFYTLLALWGWYAWDSCHQNLWFPLYVLKLGSLVYLAYLYLFYKQKELRPLSDEDLENFES